ncbi:hypothetical protein SUGI_0883700 [Cryptomeria japonica]|nr:hypothetical protein SUGI_0883700 [Cryptomeria japonica]
MENILQTNFAVETAVRNQKRVSPVETRNDGRPSRFWQLRKSSDGASSSNSSSGSVSGARTAKSGRNGKSNPIVGSVSSGGSPTTESVRRGGRSLRLGNVLNPKTLGSPSGDRKDCANNNISGGGIITGSLGNEKKPGHSRGSCFSLFRRGSLEFGMLFHSQTNLGEFIMKL